VNLCAPESSRQHSAKSAFGSVMTAKRLALAEYHNA